jgi:hypothetical protein
MNELNPTTSRRTLLQRGLLFVAGACGLQLAPREGQAALSPPAPDGSTTLTFYSKSLRAHRPGQQPGKLPTPDGRLSRHGDLLDAPDGQKVGEFAATCFGSDHSWTMAGPAGSNLEIQTLHLPDGSLFGMGASSAEQNVHAILGGTGRFAGAKGSYVIRRQTPKEQTKDCGVEFVINLLT